MELVGCGGGGNTTGISGGRFPNFLLTTQHVYGARSPRRAMYRTSRQCMSNNMHGSIFLGEGILGRGVARAVCEVFTKSTGTFGDPG